MKKKFKKGQVYKVLGTIKNDGSIPSKDSLIEISEVKKVQHRTRIYYQVLEGTRPADSEKHFFKDSEFVNDLELIE